MLKTILVQTIWKKKKQKKLSFFTCTYFWRGGPGKFV